MASMNVIQTNFKEGLERITVYMPGRITGKRTEFETVEGKRVSFVTESLIQKTSDLMRYTGDSII